jgi:SAM-dependent methyltransferase
MPDSSKGQVLRTCPVCASPEVSETVDLAERMFGMGGSFPYVRCAECDALRISKVPDDLARYYPADYYAFQDVPPTDYSQSLKMRFVRLRDRYEFTGTGGVGKAMSSLKSYPVTRYLWPAKLQPHERILDVGCGSGSLLKRLHNLGYNNLTGIDPYLSLPLEVQGLSLKPMELAEIQGPFDVVMMHHVLEHIADQRGTMGELHRLLAPGGRAVIRIPTISCEAWEIYRECWYQLDAPRHLILHSRRSFRRLAEDSGFKVKSLIDDSIEDQFIYSEMYRQGIPLNPQNSQDQARFDDALARSVIPALAKRAEDLNAQGRGDMFCAILEPISK